MTWNPQSYLYLRGHRERPLHDLLARINCEEPEWVYDLGCGPGHLTGYLDVRWRTAHVCGIDSSLSMVQEARRNGAKAHVGDLQDWTPPEGVGVAFSHAALQWLPNHPEILARWAEQMTPGSWIAVQLPGNYEAPSHLAVRDLLNTDPWRELVHQTPFHSGILNPIGYKEVLAAAGCSVEVWETTYIHELEGEDAVLHWAIEGDLNPVLEKLSAAHREQFCADLGATLRGHYPTKDGCVQYEFRRVFIAAKVGAGHG